MNIAHIVCTYPPYFGGMGNVVFQTTAALRARGHQVLTLTPQYSDPSQDEIAHVKRLAPSVSYGNAARLPQIRRELDAYDIVHLHYPFFGTANLVRKWKKDHPDKKLVITYHMDTRSPDWKGIVFALYAKFWMPKILDAADFCLASSIDYIKASDAATVYAQSKEKWQGLPFGVNTERFFPRKKPLALFEQHALDPNKETIIFVGGMDPAHYFKGVPDLIKALGLCRVKGVEVQAVLVGDGALRSSFEQMALQYKVADLVRFVGYISDTDLPFYYNMADLAVLPSTAKNEAFGMVLLEAFASGLPVIATDLPGVRTVAERAGMTVPPKDPHALADSIMQYFDPQIDRKGLQNQARKVAETEFSWEHIAEELEALYTRLININ